jgi:hypothetical protein
MYIYIYIIYIAQPHTSAGAHARAYTHTHACVHTLAHTIHLKQMSKLFNYNNEISNALYGKYDYVRQKFNHI